MGTQISQRASCDMAMQPRTTFFAVLFICLGVAQGMFQVPKQQQVMAASAEQLPGVRALEILRGADVREFEDCVEDPSHCSGTLKNALKELESHKGAVTLNDAMMVYFCMKSPSAKRMQLCRNRDAEMMHRHLHTYHDAEFRNRELLSCINGEARCPSVMKMHLDNLLLEPETAFPIQYILVYMCRYATYKAELAVCAEDAGYLNWRRAPPKRKVRKDRRYVKYLFQLVLHNTNISLNTDI